MALAFSVPLFILGYIHDESGNRTDRGLRAGAIARPVLILLIVSFPAPAQLQAGLLALLRKADKPVHLALLQMALQGESAFYHKQKRDRRENDDFGRLG